MTITDKDRSNYVAFFNQTVSLFVRDLVGLEETWRSQKKSREMLGIEQDSTWWNAMVAACAERKQKVGK